MDKHNLWIRFSHQIHATCENFNHVCFKRRRRFDVLSVFSSVLHLVSTHKTSYQNALRQMFSDEIPASSSSLCEARSKVPSYIFAEILSDINSLRESLNQESVTWHGFQIFVADGSRLNIPRELSGEGFRIKSKAYYPQGLLTTLIRASDRTIKTQDLSENFCERSAALRLLDDLGHMDLVIYDRGFLSFEFALQHIEKGIDGLFRVQGGQSFKEIDEFRKSDLRDQIITIFPADHIVRKARKNSNIICVEPINLRLIKHSVNGEDLLLATTVLRKDITAKAFGDLYRQRWSIEELFKIFKQRLNVEEFHSKKRNGIEQELLAAAVLWNLTRFIEVFVPEEHFKKNVPVLKIITSQLHAGH